MPFQEKKKFLVSHFRNLEDFSLVSSFLYYIYICHYAMYICYEYMYCFSY